jgi:PAS domain S-box-containing protein
VTRAPAAPPDVASQPRTLALASARPAPAGESQGQKTQVRPQMQPQVQAQMHPDPPPPALFDDLPDAVWRFDRRLAVVYVNAAGAQATALGRAQFIGCTLGEVDHFAPFAPLWEAKLRAVFESLETRSFKFTYPHPAGAKSFDVRLIAERGADGEATHVTAIARDVTVPRSALRATRTADALVSTLMSSARIGMAILDRDLRYLRCNAYLTQLLGVETGRLLGRRLDEACDMGAQPDVMRSLLRMRDGELRTSQQVEYQFAAGDFPWVRERRTPLMTAGGEFNGVFITVERLDRERFAETSLAALRQALDSAGEMVLEIRREGYIVDANETALAWLGYTREQLTGLRLPAIDAQLTDERYGEILQAISQGGTYRGESRFRTRAGSEFEVDLVLQRVEYGEREFIFLLVRDISERRQHQQQTQTLLAESRLIFDTALVGLLFVRDGRLLRVNAAMEELLACEPGTLVDQIQLFAHPSDRLLMSGLSERYVDINRDGACEFELYMYRRRGDPIWVAVQGRAVNPERPELGYIFAFVNIDQRKRSERELLAALNELQLIFDNALVSIVYVANDLIIKANAASERMFGFGAADLSELQFGSLFADAGAWQQVQARCATESGAGDAHAGAGFELPMRRADGGMFWCAGHVRPIEPGVIERGMIVAMTDVDVRRRSEDELRRVRNYLDLVIENLPVLVSVREVDSGRFVSFNRAGEALTGLSRDQVLGRTWHEIYGRQFADLYVEMDRQAIAGGRQIERPRDVMLRADGRTLTVNQRVVPVFEEDQVGPGAARYVMSIVDDLTGEVRAETALRETESRFRQFAESIDQLVFVTDADLTTIHYVNARYAQLLGAPASELMGDPRNVLKRVHPEDSERLRRMLPRLIAGMRRLRRAELSVRVDHPARGVRLLNVRLNPARVHDGSVRVFGIADDVTERTAAEQQRLEDALKQRDVLVREVHHRIKNNLQGVAGLLQHMAVGKPEVATTLNEIAGQIQAIAQVHGLQIGSSGNLPVLGVVQGIFANLGAMFGVEIHFEPSAPGLWRWGLPENEAVPLALVINELGTNAIKYRASRELGLTVRVETRPDGVAVLIENPGRLPAGFDLGRVASGVSGLGLIKALLPRRGARLKIDQADALVRAQLELTAPAIREELA